MGRNFAVKTVHKNMYPATYNFKDEADGTSGTDIGFVDAATLYNGACEIVSDWQSHRKVLRLTDDITPGEDPYIIHNETQATAGTREFWVGTNDVTEDWYVFFSEVGNDNIVFLRITASNLYYRDSVDAWQVVQAVSNDILYHLRVIWRADNTFDVHVDGILKVDNVATNNNQVSGIDRFNMRGYGDSEDHLYLDAYGDPTNDTDYKIGDNIHWRNYKESTDSFEGDDVGTQGTSITWVDTVDTAASVEIVQEFNEHKKILRQDYTSAAGGFDYSEHTFASQAKTGWYECWVKVNDITGEHDIILWEDAVFIISFKITASQFQIYTAGAWRQVTGSPTPVNNTWYHIYIQVYDAATDTFDLWIDNILYEDGTNCANNQTAGINKVDIRQYNASDYIYIDAPTSSLDSDERADNRVFEYNDTYTKTDITSTVHNISNYKNIIYGWRTGTLISNASYEFSEVFFEIYDINSVLAMRAEIKNRKQNDTIYSYPLRDILWDDLNEPITHTFTTDDIHDPADSTTLLLTALPNVGQEDGNLILVEGDTKTTTYSPVLKSYPTYMFLRDIADLADCSIIITPEGKVYMDDDKASGDSLDVDTATDKDKMTTIPIPTDILESINYYEIFGAINPDTGDRFYKVIDNSGTDKKRKWRYVNNEFRTQTDVDNYATALSTRVTTAKRIRIAVQTFGCHNMGETFDYKYIKGSINIAQANYYIIEERMNFDKNMGILILSEGMIEGSKYSAGFEKPQNYADSYAGEIYETDINTIDLNIIATSGAQTTSGLQITNGEYFKVAFYIDEYVDASRDMKITISYHIAAGAGGTFDFLEYFWFSKTDGSENYNANEESNTPTFTGTTLSKVFKYQYIMAASKFDAGDSILATWIMNEAGPEIRVRNITLRYYIKRTLS